MDEIIHLKLDQEFEFDGNIFRFEKQHGSTVLNIVRHIIPEVQKVREANGMKWTAKINKK